MKSLAAVLASLTLLATASTAFADGGCAMKRTNQSAQTTPPVVPPTAGS